MPPDFRFDGSERLLTVTVTGDLLADDVIQVVEAHYPHFHGPAILWDLTAADVSRFASEDFARVALTVGKCTPSGVERKTAYVVANQTAFVTLWKYLSESVRVHVPVEYKIFTSVAAAQEWLDGRQTLGR